MRRAADWRTAGWRTRPARAVAGWIVLTGLWGVSPVPAVEAQSALSAEPAATRSFVFERLNREYTNEVARPAPSEQGGFRLELSSPRNRVRMTEHELRLTPLPDGSHRAVLTVEFEGGGRVDAVISVAGTANRIEDRVTVPLQRKTLEGRVRIDRLPEGYLFTALELPERVTVSIESRLAGRFLQTCNLLRALVPLECAALGTLVSRVDFPLPDPGGSYLLSNGELTDEDRAGLDAYLRSAS